eukprot:scaffold85637_cov62-Phaeocystis_antarctica.AAC.1
MHNCLSQRTEGVLHQDGARPGPTRSLIGPRAHGATARPSACPCCPTCRSRTPGGAAARAPSAQLRPSPLPHPLPPPPASALRRPARAPRHRTTPRTPPRAPTAPPASRTP